jgi:hypothetical protein
LLRPLMRGSVNCGRIAPAQNQVSAGIDNNDAHLLQTLSSIHEVPAVFSRGT